MTGTMSNHWLSPGMLRRLFHHDQLKHMARRHGIRPGPTEKDTALNICRGYGGRQTCCRTFEVEVTIR